MTLLKNLVVNFIFQWTGKSSGFCPICLDFVYSKWEPAISCLIMFFGLGAEIVWFVPWETEESTATKELTKAMGFMLTCEGEPNKEKENGTNWQL